MYVIIIIQAEWAIEEYVRISLLLIWLSPPKAPIEAAVTIKLISRILSIKQDIRIKGASFCQVKIIKHFIQDTQFITWGNQKWKGAIPALMAIAAKIKNLVLLRYVFISNIISVQAITMRIIEAIAWARKYLIAASVDLKFNSLRIRGIKLIKLISRPSQQINQELEEIAISVPDTKKSKKRVW